MKYQIELAAAGRVSCAVDDDMPTSFLLTDLIMREQAWDSSNVELSLYDSLSLPKHRSEEWELVGGAYVKAHTLACQSDLFI